MDEVKLKQISKTVHQFIKSLVLKKANLKVAAEKD